MFVLGRHSLNTVAIAVFWLDSVTLFASDDTELAALNVRVIIFLQHLCLASVKCTLNSCEATLLLMMLKVGVGHNLSAACVSIDAGSF